MEIWKPIEGTNGRLEISSEGRVKSNLRDGRILKVTKDKKGYLRLRVTLDRIKKCYKVHRLVACAFLDNPDNLPQVNHKDGNKQNNSVNNLEWVTNYDNARHAMKNGLWDNLIAASRRENDKRKTPVIAIDITSGNKIRFESIHAAEKALGTKHITDVIKGKRTMAKGFRFERG